MERIFHGLTVDKEYYMPYSCIARLSMLILHVGLWLPECTEHKQEEEHRYMHVKSTQGVPCPASQTCLHRLSGLSALYYEV